MQFEYKQIYRYLYESIRYGLYYARRDNHRLWFLRVLLKDVFECACAEPKQNFQFEKGQQKVEHGVEALETIFVEDPESQEGF